MWAPGVSLLIWGWQLKREEHFKCRDWSKHSPQTGEGRRVGKGKFVSKSEVEEGWEGRRTWCESKGSRKEAGNTHHGVLRTFNLKLCSLQWLKMRQWKRKAVRWWQGRENPRNIWHSNAFKKNCLCSKVLILHLVKCLLIFLPSLWITVCSVSSLWREKGSLNVQNWRMPSLPCTSNSIFSSWPYRSDEKINGVIWKGDGYKQENSWRWEFHYSASYWIVLSLKRIGLLLW